MHTAQKQASLLGIPIRHWLMLVLACLLGYWPLSSMLFSLKNDAQVYFLPNRFLISDALRNGVFPWWTPYQHMGYPIHGDMQSGAWNPIVWFLSLFGRYNMHTLQWETLIYIFTGGVGMYKLSGIRPVHPLAQCMAALAYMFCGFIIDTGQITVWTASAAFIPFTLFYLHRILFATGNKTHHALKAGLFLYLLLVAGYPSFLIMVVYIWGIAILARLITLIRNKQQGINEILSLGGAILVTGTLFFILSLPALLSYIDYLPYYQRGSGTSLAEAQENPFTVFGFMSFLSPFSVTRTHDWLATNPTSRSAYIGAFSIFFLAGWVKKKKNGIDWFIAAAILLMGLFSLGASTPLRGWFYHVLPGMDLFRHPGTMRIFCITGMLMLAAPLFSDFLTADWETKKALRIRAWGFAGISAALGLLAVPGSHLSEFILHNKSISRDSLKHIFSNLTFNDGLLLDSLMQFVFFLLLIVLLGRKKGSAFPLSFLLLFSMNLILPAQLTIPATIVSRVSPHNLNGYLAQSPKGYPIPSILTSIRETEQEAHVQEIFYPEPVYRKEIVWISHNVNPSVSNRIKRLDEKNRLRSAILKNPFSYLADTLLRYRDTTQLIPGHFKTLFTGEKRNLVAVQVQPEVRILACTPGYISVETSCEQERPLVLMQQYNKHWSVSVDGHLSEVKQGNLAFMYAWVPGGRHQVEWQYKPYYLAYAAISSGICLLAVLLILIGLEWKRSDRSSFHGA